MVVAEVDESDGHFRGMKVTCAVVTNIERDHMEHHGSFENLVGAFREFLGRIPKDGVFVFCGEDATLKALAGKVKARKVSYGIGKGFDVTCDNAKHDTSIEFDLILRGKKMGRVKSPLVGRHNILNVMGAIAASLEMGADLAKVLEAAATFGGVKRRFEKVGKVGSIEVIEDYAHHPTEIRSVINAAKGYGKGRVVTIFQPHRYSRTKDLLSEFAECFYGSDVLVLTDIYSAHEDAVEKMSTKAIYDLVDTARFKRVALVDKKDVPGFVSDIAREDDVILVLGAGDIREQAEPLVRMLERKRSEKK
jgi:UDP-N-acetylmuramate--alanine ligase